MVEICRSITFMISGSCHGPLSERMQPPLSAQVHVPPKNDGSSLPTNKEMLKVEKSAMGELGNGSKQTVFFWNGPLWVDQ